jgi:DNA polymerase-1
MFFDYKQIEPRLLAYYLHTIGDRQLAETLRSGVDTYTAIVRGIYGKEELTDEERQTGKVLFLSLMYGGGIGTVMRQFGVDGATAKRMVEQFHRAWPGVRLLQATIEKRLSDRHYIHTLYGRHLHPESHHKAINALIQGCAADIIRHALINVDKKLNEGDYRGHMVSVVHDEIIMDVPINEVPILAEKVPQWMDCEQVSQVVPILVDVEWSTTTWADKQPYQEV